MITELPNNPGAYKEYWEELAKAHTNIDHQPASEERFVVINEGQINPFNGVDLSELIAKQRSTLKYTTAPGEDRKLLMVLTEWASDMEGVTMRPEDIVEGSFLLLGKVRQKDWEQKREVQDLAYAVGRELIAFTVQFFENNSRLGIHHDVQVDSVGPITEDNLHGYRFDFKWQLHAALFYVEDNFNGLEPNRIIPNGTEY